MVATSYLRPGDAGKSARRAHQHLIAPARPRSGGNGPRVLAVGALLLALGLGALAYVFAGSNATLSPDRLGVARVTLPLGGGRITSVSLDVGPAGTPDPARITGATTIWPRHPIPAGERVNVYVTVRRPGWIAWLPGSTEHLHLGLTAPSASLFSHFVTLSAGRPLVLRFRAPVSTIAYGRAGHLTERRLTPPQATVTIPHSGTAGTIIVNATLRSWESAKDTAVSYFPAGGATTAVANPAPGSRIQPQSPITLTFSTPVSRALGANLPPLTPAGSGSWQRVGSHALRFVPAGAGYGLAADVAVALPSAVHLLGATGAAGQSVGHWTVPAGTTTRLQQLLASLGYLPLNFTADRPVADTPAAQEAAAVSPPGGHFSWAYRNIPAPLRAMWAPGAFGTMTKGALMAFENDHGLASDGVPGPQVWRTLIAAADAHKVSHAGYTFVMVDKSSSPESERTWHSGQIKVSGPVNTGVAAAPTVNGIFPVFEHIPVTTMTGQNPDGSHYSDPGIRWVSYFNGGDALHAFTRAQYGFPQSVGCVEMPLAEAASVYQYTPIGTLVDVS